MTSPAAYGKQYEQSVRTRLRKIYKNIPRTAGFGTGPDLTIPAIQSTNSGQSLLVELKTSTGADFGQKAITFNGSSWVPKNDENENPQNVALYNYLFNTFGIASKIQSAWDLPGASGFTSQDLATLVETKQLNQVLYYEKMYKQATKNTNIFPQKTLLRGKTVLDAIIQFYNSKGIYYIQVKGSGFYILGNDVKGLNKILGTSIPKFAPSNSQLVLRGKPSTTGRTYRPVLTFKSSPVSRSSYSLGTDSFVQLLYNNF